MEAAHAIPAADDSSLSKPRINAGPWLVLAVLALGEFMILLDTTIVAVAVPKLSTDLSASLDQLLWVLNAYTLIFAVLLITAGRLGDILGPRKMFLSGLAIFTLASAACGFSQSPNQLIGFRALQAVGGAMLMPQTLSIITSIFPPQKRGAAFGVWSAIAGLAAVAGPTLGGVLTTAFSWRAVFFPNVPLGIIALVLAFLMMPEMTSHRRRRLDVPGVVLATVGLVALIYGVIEGQKYSWGPVVDIATFSIGPLHAGLISIPTIFLFSAIALTAFVIYESITEEPLLPLSLFRDRNFSLGNLVAAGVNFGITGLFFPLTLFLQSVLGLSALETGVVILPQAVAVTLVAPPAGRLGDKPPGKFLLFGGLLLFSLGVYLITRVESLNATGTTFTIPLFIIGLGMGCTFAPMIALSMRNIAPTAAGSASGFINTMRQVGGALGSAIVGAVLANQLSADMNNQATIYAGKLPTQVRSAFIKGIASSSTNLTVGAGQTTVVPKGVPAQDVQQLQSLGTQVFNSAFVTAMKPSMYIILPLLLLGAVAALAMKVQRVRPLPAAIPAPVPAPVAAGAPGLVPAMAVAAPVPVSMTLSPTSTLMVPVLLPTRAEAPAAHPVRPPLLIMTGAGKSAEFPLKGIVTVGRLPSNTIVLDDPEASRNHTQVMLQGGQAVVRDLNSANGTTLNGQRIVGDQRIRDGDRITIGNTTLTFQNDMDRARPRLVPVGVREPVEYVIGTRLTIGRVPGNDVVVPDSKVSRRHAEVNNVGGQIVVRDLDSLNGTRLNGNFVAGDRVLHEGDILAIGDTAFVFHNEFEAKK
jgi:EmrB/QacA subfamily drug resistance transporter